MPARDWAFRVRHIIENIERAQGFVRGTSYKAFCADEKTAFAVVTCFSMIGEAARLIPQDIRSDNPEVPWSQMTRMRNVLVHEYDRIDMEVIWSTIKDDLPAVLQQLRELLGQDLPGE